MAGDALDDWMNQAIEADPVTLDIDEVDEPSGPPLSAAEIDAAHEALTDWHAPDEFKKMVDALGARCTSKIC
jgi:hypothetical protein